MKMKKKRKKNNSLTLHVLSKFVFAPKSCLYSLSMERVTENPLVADALDAVQAGLGYLFTELTKKKFGAKGSIRQNDLDHNLVEARGLQVGTDREDEPEFSKLIQSMQSNISAILNFLDPSLFKEYACLEVDAEAASEVAYKPAITNTLIDIIKRNTELAKDIQVSARKAASLQHKTVEQRQKRKEIFHKVSHTASVTAEDVSFPNTNCWQCVTCTFENEINARKCQLCGAYRPVSYDKSKDRVNVLLGSASGAESRKRKTPRASVNGNEHQAETGIAGRIVGGTKKRLRDSSSDHDISPKLKSKDEDDSDPGLVRSMSSHKSPRNDSTWNQPQDQIQAQAWRCAVCTLENDMRARTCGACGESRAHAIRGVPSVFEISHLNNSSSRARISAGAGNPRRFPLVGPQHQIAEDELPVAGMHPSCKDDASPRELEPIWHALRENPMDSGSYAVPEALRRNDAPLDDIKFRLKQLMQPYSFAADCLETTKGTSVLTSEAKTAISALDSYLSLFPAHQALALQQLWKASYSIPHAIQRVEASLIDGANAARVHAERNACQTEGADPEIVHPTWLEGPVVARRLRYDYRTLNMPCYDGIPLIAAINAAEYNKCSHGRLLSAHEIDLLADAIAEHLDDFVNVRKYLSQRDISLTLREIQDFFYGPWCSPTLKPRATACERLYEAKIRAQQREERRIKADEIAAKRKAEAAQCRAERLRELSEFGLQNSSLPASGEGNSEIKS